MENLLLSPCAPRLDALINGTVNSLIVCSPYIGRGPCDRLVERAANSQRFREIDLFILTDLSRDNMLSGATDVAALSQLAAAFPRATVRFLPSLHAKVYVADESRAIVTSANFTDSGLFRNFEYGVCLSSPAEVRQVRADVLGYGSLGSLIGIAQLEVFAGITQELREVRKAAERSLKHGLRLEFDRKLREADDEILRTRAAGRTDHAIFADAILHLLRGGPETTQNLQAAIRQIHPDLCDDTVDRVIDGRHFGKKWKHGVRTAQVFLRRRGDILLGDEKRWFLKR
jgi:phosphatidylserine/phosphatidylglycerophosphate/cardiolipin synthase-like enzyme